jgi:hypothetical protein
VTAPRKYEDQVPKQWIKNPCSKPLVTRNLSLRRQGTQRKVMAGGLGNLLVL